jgi:hypothetical protein
MRCGSASAARAPAHIGRKSTPSEPSRTNAPTLMQAIANAASSDHVAKVRSW